MRKGILFGCMLLAALLFGCGTKEAEVEAFHFGLNGRIAAIDEENYLMTVQNLDSDSAEKEEYILDCSQAVENYQLIYCNYETGETITLEFSQLQVGDDIVIGMYQSEFDRLESGFVIAYQVQLGTQRLNYET